MVLLFIILKRKDFFNLFSRYLIAASGLITKAATYNNDLLAAFI